MSTRITPAFIGILALIAAILLIALFKIGQAIFLPAVVAVFLSMALSPIMNFLRKWKLPGMPAAVLTLTMAYLVIGTLLFLVIYSLRLMTVKAPIYTVKARHLLEWIEEYAKSFGIQIDLSLIFSSIDPNTVAAMVGNSVMYLMGIIQYGFLVFFISLFLLMEATRFKNKFNRAFGEHNMVENSLRQVGQELQRYLFFKTLISLGTGLLVWAFLHFMGVDFALVWGFLAFTLNFIPSVGSIVASIPPVLVALIQFDSPLKYALIVLLGLLTIQMCVGNYLDPRIMGETLNLSALVIFLSLAFWGWVWGPVGMLLAVPLVVCAKVILRHNSYTRRYAILLEG